MKALHTQIFILWVSGTMIDRSVLDSRSKCHLGPFTTENLCGAKIKRILAAAHQMIRLRSTDRHNQVAQISCIYNSN